MTENSPDRVKPVSGEFCTVCAFCLFALLYLIALASSAQIPRPYVEMTMI
jgi:hypothetical protein